MTSPYRQSAQLLGCPRCEELIDELRTGVFACERCEGLWIARAVLAEAFGNARWPTSKSVWWRNALACPECASDGKVTVMDARAVGEVLVDQCPAHGTWLDRSELRRVLGSSDDDLTTLRGCVQISEQSSEALIARRTRRREELAKRRAAELAFLEAQAAQRGLEMDSARAAKLAREEAERLADEQRERQRTEQQKIARDNAALLAKRQQQRAVLVRLHDDHATALSRLARLESELAVLLDRSRETQAAVTQVRATADAIAAQIQVAEADAKA